jgi:hypothetical protein
MTYDADEDLYRSLIFQQNLEIIAAHNRNLSRTYDMGLNQFSALTDQEFVKIFLNLRPYH